MELTDQQKDIVRGWVEEGCGLSEIQRRISDEFGVSMTYMDVRFLVIDLNVEIKDGDDDREAASAASAETADSADEVANDAVGDNADGSSFGGVRVELDKLVRPGALASGTVVFSDGVSAVWMLDQTGRLGLEPSQPGYRPSDADNEAFVKALQEEIAKKGY